MRRLLMGLAVAALMAAVMAGMGPPALALGFYNKGHPHFDNFDNDFDFDNENELESGPVEQDFRVVNFGDYANQCVPALQFGNSGNFNNSPSFAQFGSGGFDDGHRGFFDHGRGIDD